MGKEGLSNLYHNWRSDIPTTTVHSNSCPNNFKVRGNWFQGVVAELEDSVDKGEVPAHLVPEVATFMDTYTARNFHTDPTRPEDIARADRLIEGVLGLRAK